MDKTVRVDIEGHCHGVCFRNFVESIANLIGVCGTVENTKEGVTAYIKGGEDDIALLLTCMKYGPRAAHVTDLKVSDAPDYDFGKVFKTIYPELKSNILDAYDFRGYGNARQLVYNPTWKPRETEYCFMCLEDTDPSAVEMTIEGEIYKVCPKCLPDAQEIFKTGGLE